jgi:hypothetical protein
MKTRTRHLMRLHQNLKVHRWRCWRQNPLQYFLSTTDRKVDVIQMEGHSMKAGLALHK